jgi:hypothetical protein
MKRKIIFLLFLGICSQYICAQPKNEKMAMPDAHGQSAQTIDSWQVSVNSMDVDKRKRITRVVEDMQSRGGATRSVTTDILKAAGFGGVSSAIDVISTEIIQLASYRKQQKKKWMQMIENEDNYTDSLSSIKGLNDFYLQSSRYGALDPSNINFDGISIRGLRRGHEVLYMSCHVDTIRIAHLFQHSKFNLVVDTISFNPYECHLPNLSANGIRLMGHDKSGRDNSFSFNERENLSIGMELTLLSSWINEAVLVQNNIPLGTFKLNVNIPSGIQIYKYSRRMIERNRKMLEANPSLRLDTSFVQIEGDCFVVPRSYMPISGSERMWGTGEYNIKVKFREACRFSQDASRNEKLKHWRKDYKELRKMQKKGSEFTEYFRTLWSQNGNTLMKTMLKQGMVTGAAAAGLSNSGNMGGGARSGAGSMPVGTMSNDAGNMPSNNGMGMPGSGKP